MTLWAWFSELLEGKYNAQRLGLILTRAIGTSPAALYWRLFVEQRKRRPRPANCPTLQVWIGRESGGEIRTRRGRQAHTHGPHPLWRPEAFAPRPAAFHT